MRLWVDDERSAPEGWFVAETSQGAIAFLQDYLDGHVFGVLEEISLDHDLGGDDTGMKVLDWMVEHNVWPKTLTIHTSNPPARQRMLAAANAEAPPYVEIYVIYDHLSKD
jgi:hypothetical protein